MDRLNPKSEMVEIWIYLASLAALIFISKLLVMNLILWGIVGAFLGLSCLRIIFHPMKSLPSVALKWALRVLAFALVALYAWRGLSFIPSEIILDNYGPHRVAIFLRDEAKDTRLCSLEPDSSSRVKVYPGKHEIVVKPVGKEYLLDKVSVDVGKGHTYVFNIQQAVTYLHGEVQFGSLFGSGTKETESREKWFEPHVDYLFENPPRQIEVPEEGKVDSRSYLKRRIDPRSEGQWEELEKWMLEINPVGMKIPLGILP